MAEKLSWDEIEAQYDKEWVELVDYDWPEGDTYPRAGIVRIHSKDHAEFHRLAAIDTPKDSALVFVGKHTLPPGHVFSPGFRMVISHA